jgi:hypothetical protein
MAAQHTPGPWIVTHGQLLRVQARGQGEGWKSPAVICGVHRLGRLLGAERTAESAANAVLIAAAPELLDALKALRAAVADHPAMQGRQFVSLGIQVNNAIAKAEAA